MTEWIQNKVTPPCAESRRVGQERQNQLTKPQGSLGRLEGLAIDFAGFQKTPAAQFAAYRRARVCCRSRNCPRRSVCLSSIGDRRDGAQFCRWWGRNYGIGAPPSR